jgi:uncharacterized protein (TIGR02118 family)
MVLHRGEDRPIQPALVERHGQEHVAQIASHEHRYGPAVIKLTFCLTRKEGLSREEFQAYWRETHAPLVASVAETLNIRRYVQAHTVDDAINDPIRASRGGPPSYDGVAELWWDSLESLGAPGQTEEGRAAGAMLLEDERRFIDLSRSPLFFGEEHEIVNR